MVTMDAYDYHQGNNPGNSGKQYVSAESSDDEDVDRKDILVDSSGYDDSYNNYAGYSPQQEQQQQQQQPMASTSTYHPFYGAAPYMIASSPDIKPIISDIPPLVPPMYLQTSASYAYNDYQSNMSPSTSSSNLFHQSYPYYKAWHNQVKSEQMANILNR